MKFWVEIEMFEQFDKQLAGELSKFTVDRENIHKAISYVCSTVVKKWLSEEQEEDLMVSIYIYRNQAVIHFVNGRITYHPAYLTAELWVKD